MSSKPPEVTRWTEAGGDGAEVPAELRRLLELSRDQLGTPGEVAGLAQGLARALGPLAELGNSAGPPALLPAPLAASRWAAWAAAGGAVAAGAAVLWAVSSRPPPELAATPAPPRVTAAAPQAPPEPPASPASADAGLDKPESREATPAARPVAKAKPKRASPRARARPVPPRPDAVAEAELLERAQAALSKRPSAALALTREHKRRFPRGALVQEREVIAIEALSRLGQSREASARAAEFERRYRGSVHQRRLDDDADRATDPAPASR